MDRTWTIQLFACNNWIALLLARSAIGVHQLLPLNEISRFLLWIWEWSILRKAHAERSLSVATITEPWAYRRRSVNWNGSRLNTCELLIIQSRLGNIGSSGRNYACFFEKCCKYSRQFKYGCHWWVAHAKSSSITVETLNLHPNFNCPPTDLCRVSGNGAVSSSCVVCLFTGTNVPSARRTTHTHSRTFNEDRWSCVNTAMQFWCWMAAITSAYNSVFISSSNRRCRRIPTIP